MKKACIYIGVVTALLSAAFLVLPSRTGAQSNALSIDEDAVVSGSDITLGDIATIEGDLGFITRAENIVVGSAPLPGRKRSVKRPLIEARLRQHDINPRVVRISCPEEFTVTTAYRSFSVEEIQNMTRDYILAHMPWDRDMVEISGFICEPVRVPTGSIDIRFEPNPNENYRGRFTAHMVFGVDGQDAEQQRVSAYITVVAPVAVARRKIERHEVVERDDFTMKPHDITHFAGTPVMDASDIAGMRTKGRIRDSEVLKLDFFEKAPLVYRGEIVRLVVETDFFHISAPGEVLEDGCIGETVKVSNLSSDKKVYGTVRGRKHIEVSYK